MFKASGQVQFDKLLEKATSNLLLEPEWSSIMMICDLIRQKDCPPKYAMQAIKKKLHHQNPHVAMFGLQVLESVVKNCGGPVHDEVASKQFMEELREIAKTTHHENVKEKILELVLTWAHAFRKIPSYRAVQDVLNIMKAEGMAFKPLVESDAMFVADTAPEWADGECCHRCRTEFGLVVRKHHCRACGQIFCSKCSSKMCTLPKFGIEKEVRVCDSCFEKYGKNPPKKSSKKSKKSSDETDTLSTEDQILQQVLAASLAESQAKAQQPPAGPRAKTEEELAEEEQLQLALAISQSEAEAKEMEARKRGTSNVGGSQAYSFPPETSSSSNDRGSDKSPHKSVESEDPELARYLNRNYWENKAKDETSKEESGTAVNKSTSFTEKSPAGNNSKNASAAGGWNSNNYSFMPSAPYNENKDKGEQAEEIDTFVGNLRDQIEIFVNRMKSNSSRGRPIAYDTSVQGLFMNITALHSQLLNFIQIQDNSRTYYEGLQDKLGQIRDARAALDDLRQEHSDRLRRQAEEQERIKQYQMAQKLHIMRQKKQEYLQYQRQLAMQRMQEQEREMQMRIEQQQKQQIGVPPYGGYQQSPQSMQGYMPQGPPQPEMAYMQQQQQHGPPPHGQFAPPPNVTLGQQMPGQQMNPQMGQYMQHPQHHPGGQYIPQQGPPTGQIPPGMNNQGHPQQQQQQQQPQQHNPIPQQQMSQQQPQNPMQHQQPQQIPQNYPGNVPTQEQQPPPIKSEPSTAELISFD